MNKATALASGDGGCEDKRIKYPRMSTPIFWEKRTSERLPKQ